MAKSAYEKTYETLKKAIQKTDVSGWNGFAFQFIVTGDAAGTFYAKLENGANKITVENFDYKGADATFKADANTFTALVEGKIDSAKALESGKLIVEGNNDPAGCANIFAAIAPKKAAKAAEKAPAKAAAKKPAAKKAPAKKEDAPKTEAKPAAVKTEVKPAAPAKAEVPKADAAKKPAAKKPGRKPAAKK